MGKVDRAKEAIDTVFYDLSRNERITLEALRELRRHLDELINTLESIGPRAQWRVRRDKVA